MCAKSNPDIERDVVIQAISRIASVNEDGHASFRGLEIERYLAILTSALEFDANIGPSVQGSLVWRAVCDAVEEGKLTAGNVVRLVAAGERAHLREPLCRYVLLTDISAKLPSYPLRIRIAESTLTFTEYFPARFDRKKIAKTFRDTIPAEFPRDYSWVRVATAARCQPEAADRALVALDLLRGIWNLAITFRRFRKSIPTRGPVNDIVLGPVQTLHQPNGTPAGNVYWYQPSYRQAVRPADLSGKMQGLRSFELRVRSRLRGAKDGELLSRALVRYARAQDEPDLENVFLSLWSLLETLTDTLKTSYDYTIRRAAFLWKDQGLALQELRHLRLWRNRTVHRGESSEERETHVYQLKMYVDALLAFLLLDPNNRNKAFSEIAQFLDLPHDTGALRKMIAVYQRGLKLRARIR